VRPAVLRKRVRLTAMLRMADGVVAGNEYLAAYARRWNPRVTVLPTPIDAEYYSGPWAVGRGQSDESSRSTAHGPLRLGWVGHPDNLGYLRRLEPVFGALAKRFPGLALRVVCSEPYESRAIPVENVPWTLAEEVANLRALDIGIMPLEDDPWARGKCAYKALQYMAVGVPVVCSPVGMNVDIITEGENGLLAADLDAWERQLALLIESPELRQRLGAAGRRTVEEQYSLTVMAERLTALLAAPGNSKGTR
jgi:glycosyltransferase involved in cell wall biosynthesis